MKRRDFLIRTGLTIASVSGLSNSLLASPSIRTRVIPSTGEKLPVVGMGTWQTFNVGVSQKLREARTKVLAKFFERGGTLIDSSPMYGSAEDVVGYGLNKLNKKAQAFAATKVWTSSTEEGQEQFEQSQKLWQKPFIELEQVHNLLNLEGHLETLFRLKEEKKIRYVGITTSHQRRHADFEKAMKKYPLDFVQFTYNIERREAEARLLPLAKEKGIAVIVNRPYGGGGLIDRVQRRPLPQFSKSEAHAKNWPEYLLKFILGHPAVTCMIPATSQVVHMEENMAAGYGDLPDQKTRKKMIASI